MVDLSENIDKRKKFTLIIKWIMSFVAKYLFQNSDFILSHPFYAAKMFQEIICLNYKDRFS